MMSGRRGLLRHQRSVDSQGSDNEHSKTQTAHADLLGLRFETLTQAKA